MLGLVNGSFYALLSLGLAVIFGLLGVVNFAHGAFYMLGALAAYFGLRVLGITYGGALLLRPVGVGLWGSHAAPVATASVSSRTRVWTVVDVWNCADRRGHHAQPVRCLRQVLSGAGAPAGRLQPRFHDVAHLSRVGGAGVGDGVRPDLVPDRAHSPGREAASGDRERATGAGI